MAENKTKATDASVDSYIAAIEDEVRRKDCQALAKLMRRQTLAIGKRIFFGIGSPILDNGKSELTWLYSTRKYVHTARLKF